MNVIQLLREAVATLKEDGWTKHTFHSTDGKHCALGAVREVLGETFGRDDYGRDYDTRNFKANELYGKAIDLLNQSAGAKENFGSIVEFNDSVDTKLSDVRAAFGEAIRLAKEGV